MEHYTVHTLPPHTEEKRIDWASVPTAGITHFKWLSGYTPESFAQLVYIPETGFVLRMTSEESHPRAVLTHDNDPVCTDSCLEFFADWLGDGRYINVEMNANGTLLSYIGPDRFTRTPIVDLTGGETFPVTAEVKEKSWSVTAVIPERLIARIYGTDTVPFRPGFTFHGNFYKCGDQTEIPHYGMWNPVTTEQPDFHVPSCFGELTIV